MFSKIMELIRSKFGRKKPFALSIEDWQEFYESYKKDKPVAYFFCETLPKKVTEVYRKSIGWPMRRAYEWFYYRFMDRYHVVDTGLSPGYYDKDVLMLHANFTILKRYVEQELGWMKLISMNKDDALYDKYKLQKRLTDIGYFRRKFHSRELGVQYLTERVESNPYDGFEDSDDAEMVERQVKQLKDQMFTDEEVLRLYLWWEDEFKNRTSIFNDYVTSDEYTKKREEFEEQYGTLYILNKKFQRENPEWYAEWKKRSDESREIEEQQDIEDDMMLERLMKIRKTLWT